MHPVRREAVRSITLPGDLVGFYETALHAKVTGYLRHIYVDKGDVVAKGQLLADIEVPELRQNLERALARRRITKLTWQRLKHVRDTDPRLVSQETVDVALAKYQEAAADVDLLQTMVGYTQITAPFSGVITGRFVDPGALIRAGGGEFGLSGTGVNVSSGATEGAGGHLGGGGPVLTMSRLDKLRIYVYVPENEVPFVRVGMPAIVRPRAMPGQTFKATVTRFAKALDLATRTMLTEIDVENPQHQLYPRMYAEVTLDLVRHPGAIELPPGAVGEPAGASVSAPQSNNYVYVVKGGVVHKVKVSTGISDGHFIEITSGLSGDELVISDYNSNLRSGEKVHPVMLGQNGIERAGTVASAK